MLVDVTDPDEMQRADGFLHRLVERAQAWAALARANMGSGRVSRSIGDRTWSRGCAGDARAESGARSTTSSTPARSCLRHEQNPSPRPMLSAN
jgi:hypothetical protein